MDCPRDYFDKGVVLDGRFETVSPLNHGSFGMVFMAKDLQTDEIVAIKCLTKKSAVSEEEYSYAVDERSEELECHSRLGCHPNIVNLIHSFETVSHIFIVLEFCSHGDLYEAIRNGTGPSQTEHVRLLMLQLVDAVAYIHKKGLYHRDIKPENIFLTQSRQLKLGDFGLATREKWTYETTVGSDRYMAPEQYDSAGAGYAPEKADIWAIGICLLNILFSRNPFAVPTESDPLFLDYSRDRQSLFDVFPSMTQDTFEVITQCLSLDPQKRSLRGVREAIERLVSFTTSDESYDEFPLVERNIISCANRLPLRTPSIQSPEIESGGFQWAKALQGSLPMQYGYPFDVSDEDSLSEDLFPGSEESSRDWFSMGQQTPSAQSTIDSSFGTSINSISSCRERITTSHKISPENCPASLPIDMLKLSPFGSDLNSSKVMSKSWNDLWEEEEEEEAARKIKLRQIQNSRTWSHESELEVHSPQKHCPVDQLRIQDPSKSAAVLEEKRTDIDGDSIADGFFFQDIPSDYMAPQLSPRYSPPYKRNDSDKWLALGERRRAHPGSQDSANGFELSKKYIPKATNETNVPAGSRTLDWNHKTNLIKEFVQKNRPKGILRKMDRVRDHIHDRARCRGNPQELEWVGGWTDLHL
ncbi:unnamed protein product [Blumeria hordei]|uniref:non-specific serine/threonine protein kinase n=1 Tax=Blumeria hordei TaxID=2867405 RepID=A0A383UV83_BLUHO|nr:unnamed protein product [Blumeria hordei]